MNDETTIGPDVSNNPPEPPQPRRGPGRPRKTVGDAVIPNGGPPSETAIPGGVPPRRGRPPKQAVEVDIPLLARQLKGLHQMAAMMTGLSLLAIADTEAELLAQGLGAVAKEYNLSLDGKTGAAIQLLGACAMVYVPRLLELSRLRAQKKRATTSGEPSNVVGIDGTPIN